MKFVIVGTGRSGSGYIARVLSQAGIRCGHERVFNPFNEKLKTDLVGDSSWCAMAPRFRDELPEWVFLQTRHPLKVVSSFAKKWDRTDAYWDMKASTIKRPLTGDDLVDGMACYVDVVTEALELADMTWRLEDVNADLIYNLALLIGEYAPFADQAIAAVPKNINQHVDGADLTWEDLPASDLKQELRDLAERLGYE